MTSKKRVVLVHRYFRPDTPPYATMLAEIAEALAASGFHVEVITAQPSYGDSRLHNKAPKREQIGDVHIVRLPLLSEAKTQTVRRGINLVLFALQVWWRIRRQDRPDVVMAATTPPVLVALAAQSAARSRKAAFVYHNQDVYPEVLGMQRGRLRAALLKRIRRWDSRTGSRSTRVVVLSDDMVKTWQSRGLEHNRLAIVNNFDPTTDTPVELPSDALPGRGTRRVVFAGNVGKFQDVPTLVRAVEQVASRHQAQRPKIELVVVGDGASLEESQKVAGPATTFIGRVPSAEAAAWVRSSHLAVVSLAPELIRYVYPSKTFGYLSAGVPVLVVVEQDSELAKTITDNQVGWVASPSNQASIEGALEAFLAADAELLATMAGHARTLSEQHSQAVVLGKWVQLFREVTT